MLSVRNCGQACAAGADRQTDRHFFDACRAPGQRRLATFAHPIRSTSPTIAISTFSDSECTIAQARGAAAGGNHRRADSVPSGQLTQPDIGRLGEKLLERGIDRSGGPLGSTPDLTRATIGMSPSHVS